MASTFLLILKNITIISMNAEINFSLINFFKVKTPYVHVCCYSDVDPHWSYADPDPQNLVDADPDLGQKISDVDPGQKKSRSGSRTKKSLNLFRTIF